MCELVLFGRRGEGRSERHDDPRERERNAKLVPGSLERDEAPRPAPHRNEHPAGEMCGRARTRCNRETRSFWTVDRERGVASLSEPPYDCRKSPGAAAGSRPSLDPKPEAR